ncbi:MAG TPA: hypothetical protein VHY35_21745 [Stellaceae bacterium]|nr:hypothetical protein [Stellaceae bacterium]
MTPTNREAPGGRALHPIPRHHQKDTAWKTGVRVNQLACPCSRRRLEAGATRREVALLEALMKVVRFTSAPDGGSQFVEVDIPIDEASTDAFGNTVHRSRVLPAQSTMVTDMPAELYQDWHPASRRQLLFVLSGTLEVETSDGKKRQCSGGEVFLADDVGSRGHRTRTIGGPARVLFVHLPPEASIGG